MRFNLIDLLFAIVSIAIGAVLGEWLASGTSALLRAIAMVFGGVCLYLALIYPFYRGLKLFPMILPRCPCCGNFQAGFHILNPVWPRITLRCPTCNGEFIVWHNGKPSNQETWDKPVLALKWPYAFGVYKRMNQPETSDGSGGDLKLQ